MQEYFVWITELPLPPSVNQYLMPVQSRLVKTQAHRDYDQQFTMWVLRNQQKIESIKSKIKAVTDTRPFPCLKVDMYFCFHQNRVFNQDGSVDQLDRDNRIKPAQDQIHKIIGIDDKHIFSGNSEKITCERKAEECLIIRIATAQARSKTQILDLMHSEVSLSKNQKSQDSSQKDSKTGKSQKKWKSAKKA